MMRVHLRDAETGALVTGDAALIAQWQRQPGSHLWLDIEAPPSAAERELLSGVFGIHASAVDDAFETRRPPKIEDFGDVLFILLRGLDAATEDIDFGVLQLGIFIGERFLVTRHTLSSPSTDALWREVAADPGHMVRGDALAIGLASRVAQRFVQVLLRLEVRLEELEGDVFERPDDALLAELTGYQWRLKQLRRIANYHVQIAARLSTRPGRLVGAALAHEINDLRERLDRSLSLADLYYEQASDLINGYLALASHRLNQIMRILTIITVTFVPLSFLAGIYGMNFDNMPELHTRFGYFALLVVMALVVIGLYLFFRRRKWL